MKKALAAVARCAVVVGRQRLHVILTIIFLLVILIQAVPHYLSADQGRPYESWDEIATYNNAHVLVRPASDRSFRYGSIDTFLQWIGIVGYDYLSYIGATHSHFDIRTMCPRHGAIPSSRSMKRPGITIFGAPTTEIRYSFRDDCIWHSPIASYWQLD